MSNFVNKTKTSFIFFIIILILNYLKTPYIFKNGRFIEIDAINYANALNSSWSEVIFFVYWPAGYLNLFPNISGFLNSRLVNLEHATLFNNYFCFSVVILIHIFILFYKSSFFKKSTEKYLASVVIAVSPIFVFEIWLNSMNVQVYLCILTFVILFIQHNNFSKILSPIILFFSGLSGVYSCLLTPLFFYRCYKIRSKINIINFLILLFSSIIQLSIIIFAKITNSLSPGKLNPDFFLNLNEIESFVYNILIRPFLSTTLSNYLIEIFHIEKNINLKIVFIVIVFFLILLYLTFFLKMMLKQKTINFQLFSLIYLFLSCSILVTLGGVNDSVGGRYSVLPSFCIIFFLIKIFYHQNVYNYFRYISIGLILCSLITGIYDYRIKKWIIFYECINCPEWKEEITKFQADKTYKVKVWPYDVVNEVDLTLKYFNNF